MSRYTVVEIVQGDALTVSSLGTYKKIEKARDAADFAIECHIDGMFSESLEFLESRSIKFNGEVRGLRLTDGEYSAYIFILGKGFCFSYL